MLFSSYGFLFLFLPIAVGLFYFIKNFLGERGSLFYLIIASLLFYGIYYPGFILILMISVLFNMITAHLMNKIPLLSKFFLVIGILCNLSGLVFLKYTNMITDKFDVYFPQDIVALSFLFPLGAAFLSFNQISYLISVYKKETQSGLNLEYCLKSTFFPALVMGPVYDFKKKLIENEKEEFIPAYHSVAYGIYILIIGLFKMVVLADSLYIYVFNGMRITNAGFIPAWLTVLSFTFQIYFYFSGYCDMAVGIGKIFGLNIEYNFLSPYKAASLREFSDRWHISLTGIIKETIYVPVTSKSKNKFFISTGVISAAVIGSIWYGCSFNVLIFGLAFGILLSVENVISSNRNRLPKLLRGIFTFLIINLLFVLLGTKSPSQALDIYKGLFNFRNTGISQISTLTAEGSLYFPGFINNGYFLITILLSAVLCFLCKNTKEIISRAKLTVLSAIGLGFLLLIVVIYMTRLEFLF